jgi:hypothetical protein
MVSATDADQEARVYYGGQCMRFAVDVEYGCLSMHTASASTCLMHHPRDRNVVYAYLSDPPWANSFEAELRVIVPRLQDLTTVTCAMLGTRATKYVEKILTWGGASQEL